MIMRTYSKYSYLIEFNFLTTQQQTIKYNTVERYKPKLLMYMRHAHNFLTYHLPVHATGSALQCTAEVTLRERKKERVKGRQREKGREEQEDPWQVQFQLQLQLHLLYSC